MAGGTGRATLTRPTITPAHRPSNGGGSPRHIPTGALDRRGTWRTFGLADGLAGVRAEHIAEDGRGDLWFATWDNGVSRFDGDQFQSYGRGDGLCGDRVFSILRDGRDRLWFATLSGVCWYDGRRFHHPGGGPADRSAQFLFEDAQSRLWCAGTGTLGYFQDDEFHDLVPRYVERYGQPPSPRWTNQCWGIAQDGRGDLWFAFDHLVRYDGRSFNRYAEPEGLPPDASCYAIGQDPAGCLWIGRAGDRGRIWRFADGSFDPVAVDLPGSLRKIQCDRDGRMWLCTSGGALYQTEAGFDRVTTGDGLPYPVVNAVFQDPDRQHWFATWGGGVAQGRAGQLLVGQWENGTTARREELFASALQIVRRQGQRFVTVFREEDKEDPFNHIGALVAARNGELWYARPTATT